MLQFKLHKQLYFITLLASLISFSSNLDYAPIEKFSIEILHLTPSNTFKIYDFKDGLITNNKKAKQVCNALNISCISDLESSFQTLNYNKFSKKYIPLQRTKLYLNSQYFSSFIDSITNV